MGVVVTLVMGMLALSLAGCANWQTTTPPEPSTYDDADTDIPRTVGRLRRLLLIPIVRSLPVSCKGSVADDDWRFPADDGTTPRADWAATAFAARGYEVVERETVTSGIDWVATRDALRVAIEEGTPDTIPDATAALVRAAGTAAKADGVAVVLSAETCQRASRAMRLPTRMMDVMSLGLIFVIGPHPETLKPEHEAFAAVFETRRGVMVWRSYRYGQTNIIGNAIVPGLFSALEPAVPALLTR